MGRHYLPRRGLAGIFMSAYDLMYRYGVFPLLDWYRGYGLLGRVKRLQQLMDLPTEQLHDICGERLREMAMHASTTCPFWQRRFASAGLNPQQGFSRDQLRQLPILEKEEVREQQHDMLSHSVPASKRIESYTGGSTAAPLRFYLDVNCAAEREACRWLFYRWFGRSQYDRSALIWGAMQDLGHIGKLRGKSRMRLLHRAIVLPGNRMDEPGMIEFLQLIHRYRPKFLHGYAQAVYWLAHFMRQTRASAAPLQDITVTAEAISDAQRKVIQATFGCPVYSLYGTREFGIIASEHHTQGIMHINPLSVLVEFVDSMGNRVPPGQHGHIVVTDLLNRAMPLFRYRIGDIGVGLPVSGSDDKGLPIMSIQASRDSDFVITPSGRCVAGATITLITAPGVLKLQYVQSQISELEVRYVKSGDFHDSSLQHLQGQLRGVFGSDLQFRFIEVPDISKTPSGKLEYVRSTLSRDYLRNGKIQLSEIVDKSHGTN